MILFILFTITVAINFLFLSEKSAHPPLVKLQEFNSDTFTIRTIFNITMGSLGQCKFDNLNNVYFTTIIWDNYVQYVLVKVNIITKTTSSVQSYTATLLADNDNMYIISSINTRYQLSQLNWPNFTSMFIFDHYITLFYNTLFIPNSKLYVFAASMLTGKGIIGCLIIMSNDNGFRISQILTIEIKIFLLYHHHNTTYLMTRNNGLLELSSLSLYNNSTNYVVKYNVSEYYTGTLFNDTLYFISKTDNGDKCWIETNMINFTYTVKKLPSHIPDVRCMKVM